MKHQLHFGSATPAREALQTKTLIADINRIVQILDSDIAAEAAAQTGRAGLMKFASAPLLRPFRKGRPQAGLRWQREPHHTARERH